MYRNVTERFQWGGLDKVTAPGQLYLDETVRRMVTTNRSSMLDLATALVNEAVEAEQALAADSSAHRLSDAERSRYTDFKTDRYTKAVTCSTLCARSFRPRLCHSPYRYPIRQPSSICASESPPAMSRIRQRLCP